MAQSRNRYSGSGRGIRRLVYRWLRSNDYVRLWLIMTGLFVLGEGVALALTFL